MAKAKQTSPWITLEQPKVSRLPDKYTPVLAYYGAYDYEVAHVDDEGFWIERGVASAREPLAWMPLPEFK